MLRRLLWCAAFISGTSFAASVQLPGGGLTVPGTATTGVSFTYTGTLTQADTIGFTQTGNPCLQAGGTAYCVNGAGVLTVAAAFGGTPVGGATTFSGPAGVIPAGTWTYGALLMTISGVGTVQVFPAVAANGLGSPTPPANLTLPGTSLAALGFPPFSVSSPTITLILADTNYSDNSGGFVLAQEPSAAAIPTLGPWGFAGLAILLVVAGWVILARGAL